MLKYCNQCLQITTKDILLTQQMIYEIYFCLVDKPGHRPVWSPLQMQSVNTRFTGNWILPNIRQRI